jgi:hypothetical protein
LKKSTILDAYITPNTQHPTIENLMRERERERKREGRGAVKASKLSTKKMLSKFTMSYLQG